MSGKGKPYPTQQFASAPPVMQHNQGPYNPSQYPPQSGAYPPLHRGPYPMQQNPVGGAYPPAEPPPPYYVTDPYAGQYPRPTYPPVQSGAYPPPQTYPPQSAAYPPQPGAYPVQQRGAYPAGVQVTGEFDPSARFGSGAGHNIPPPPPGVMPNAAQVASINGQSVQMSQRPAGWLGGHESGGFTFW